jgi:hypothetical protein
MIVTCHQPNFFPWEPFFQKASDADVLVLLTNVQFARHQFQNRFQFKSKWQTMKVNKGHLSDLISQKYYINPAVDWLTIKRAIGYEWLPIFDECIQPNLAQTNSAIILKILEILNLHIKVKFDKPGKYYSPTEKILDICKQNSATIYLSGPSGRKYLDLSQFSEAGIEVKFSNFRDLGATRPILEKLHYEYNQ